jgi:hypothetical protein
MMLFTIIGACLLLFGGTKSENMYYFYCAWLGLGTGYWAMFVTMGAEQFGTNIRSTATTTIPNMVRGIVPVMLLAFDVLKVKNSVITAAAIVGFFTFALGIYSTLTISETHNKDLDFIE